MVSVNGKTKPMVVVGFDGFYASTASVALPLFKKYGIKGYNSSSGNNIAASKATCDALYNAGWDLIQQGQRLGNYGTDANAGTLAADVLTARAQFDANGYTRGRNIFTYPYNSRQAASDTVLAAAGFKCAAATGDGCFAHSQLGSGGIMGVGRNSLNNVTAVQAQAALDAAIANGGHIWYYGHDLVGSITDANTQMLTSEFTTFMAYLAGQHFSGACEVVTPSEFLARVYPI
jgi:peptidoglycan/xylan/chitin deacetylase (PgdA/CDA1 family)